MENILIIGAHFDDSDLGAGGTAARLAAEGKNVYKLTLTDNVHQYPAQHIDIDYDSSKRESAQACNVLGIHEITDFNPAICCKLEYSQELMRSIEKYVQDLNIDTMFFHFDADMNTDHVLASRLCLTAGRHCKNILQFQSNGYILDKTYYPTFFVDVSDYIDKKRQALACYGKQHDRFGRLFDITIEKNHVWGYANEVEYAEGFHVVKMLY